MPLTLRPIAHSEIGLVRKTNQDSGYVSTSTLIVADGMGGAAAGDLASGLAIHDLCHVDDTPPTGEEAMEALKEYTFQANDDISRLIGINPTLDGMGTTICGGIFDGRTMNIVHIGDSRGYLVSDGVLTRLTHDHSYVQSLIDDGRLDESEAMNHPHRSLLLKVLNGQPDIKPDFFSVELRAGDRIMFCSDGLCGLVGDTIIGTVMQIPDPAEVMGTLVELAHIAGGTDNITIIMADVVEEGEHDEMTVLLDETIQEETLPATGPGSPQPEDGSAGTQGKVASKRAKYPTSGLIGAAADPRIVSMLDILQDLGPDTDHMAVLPPPAAKLTSAEQERRRYTPRVKRSHKGFWIILAAILVVLGGAGWGVYSYVSSQFFVGAAGGQVVIYQGLPGTIAGIDTSKVYETTTINLTDLPTSWRDKVTATIPTSGLDQARTSVQEIRAKAEQCRTERANRPAGSQPSTDGC